MAEGFDIIDDPTVILEMSDEEFARYVTNYSAFLSDPYDYADMSDDEKDLDYVKTTLSIDKGKREVVDYLIKEVEEDYGNVYGAYSIMYRLGMKDSDFSVIKKAAYGIAEASFRNIGSDDKFSKNDDIVRYVFDNYVNPEYSDQWIEDKMWNDHSQDGYEYDYDHFYHMFEEHAKSSIAGCLNSGHCDLCSVEEIADWFQEHTPTDPIKMAEYEAVVSVLSSDEKSKYIQKDMDESVVRNYEEDMKEQHKEYLDQISVSQFNDMNDAQKGLGE